MAQHHDLKILPCYFNAVADGTKTFEIRDDRDRGFQKGDSVTLHEYDPEHHSDPQFCYTGNMIDKVITYVTAFEQKPGFVVFAMADIKDGQ